MVSPGLCGVLENSGKSLSGYEGNGMRIQLLTIVVLAPVLGIFVTYYLRTTLEQFINRNGFIETARQLEEYKSTAKTTMYGSLLQVMLLFPPLPIYLLGFAVGSLMLVDFLFVVAPLGVYVYVFARCKQLEERVRKTRMDNQELLDDFIHVSETWKNKSIPDW